MAEESDAGSDFSVGGMSGIEEGEGRREGGGVGGGETGNGRLTVCGGEYFRFAHVDFDA